MAVKVGNSWVSEAALSYVKVKAAGTIINADGSVSGWAITEDDNGDESREKTKLDKRDTWEKKILEMHKQKRIKEKKEARSVSKRKVLTWTLP